ncbi:MAG: methyltransferase domain-containing protein [Halobacteriales archaeon]
MGLLDDKRRARWFYRFLSRFYDRVNPVFWNEEMRADCVELLDVREGERALDVGCGTGFGTLGLLERTDDVVGLDQSAHQIRVARTKSELDDVELVLGDAERMPFPDDEFDVVWSSGSIEYWPRPVETLEELRRVARPGGRVLVVGPRRPSNRVLGWLADRVMLFYSVEEADRMFEAAGWRDVDSVVMGSDYVDDDAVVTTARAPET